MYLLNLIKNNKLVYSGLFIILILLGVLFSYQYIFQTYFAMDEWSFWMHFLKYGPFYVIKSTGLISSLTGGARFGLDLTNGIYFSLFGLNILPWNITFLSLHLLNIFLLYKILRKFKLAPFSAFLASFYFAIASAGQEALSWPAAGMQVLGTTPFILATTLLTLSFIESKKKKFLILAIVCSYLSFVMRPTGIVTVAVIIFLIFLFYKRPNILRLPRIVIIIGASAFLLGLFRLLTEYSDKLNLLTKAIFNVIFFPLVSLSHIFIPYRLMFRLGDGFINFYYPLVSKDANVDTISHLIVGDFISIVISFFILILIFLLYKKVGKYHKKVIIFGLILYFLQYFVIALFYIDRGGLSYLASRHTYTSVAGIAIIFGVLFNFMINNLKTSKSFKKYILISLFLLVGFWLFKEMTVTRREVRAQAIDDIAIKKTWESLKSVKTPNSNKVVIFLMSDRSYYYPEYRLPFKIPAAYMLPLSFHERPFIDKCILGQLHYNNTFINCNSKQFGYFTDIDKLASLVNRGEIEINDVIGLHFVDSSYTFKDTTQETRGKIKMKLNDMVH